MERIARIEEMEAHLNRAAAAVKNAQADPAALIAVQDSVRTLVEYYESPLWREDLEADEAGLLPKELCRGVLSEDALYDLLSDYAELLRDLTL